MGRTVRELLHGMDAAELQEWVAYYELDPWTQDRADLRAGIVAATVANANSTKGKFRPADFMVDYAKRHREPKTPEQLKDMARIITAMMGGKVE
jgi:hypothetical protein